MSNRVIKFRVWDGKKIKYDWFDISSDGTPFCINQFETYESLAHWKLMQFTGLTDKNGVEIYEGDIVRILYTDWPSKTEDDERSLEQYMNDLAKNSIVVWNTYDAKWSLERHALWYSIHPGEHGFIEVIGNIYQNPELPCPTQSQPTPSSVNLTQTC